MTDLSRTRTALARAAEVRAHEETQLQRLRANLVRLETTLSDAQRRGESARVAALRAERSVAETELASASARTSAARTAVDELRATLLAAADPRRMAPQLDDRTPFLLLPLRLETRWVQNELWIRAFPDEIAISAHEPALTEDELARGKAFWTEAWGADEATTDAAWQRLLAGGAANRAAWIARVLRPTNTAPAAPQFPAVDGKAASWTAAPHSEVMPDQLVFTLYTGDTVAHQVVGPPIPSPLAAGPDPTVGITRDAEGGLVVDDAMRWVVDFERALAVGLAARIPINAAERSRGFDRLVVLGIRISTDVARNAAIVEALFDAHHFGDGLELLPQGTPTNHSEAAAAGTGVESVHARYTRELGAPLFEMAVEARDRSDGERLARALGIDPAVLAHLRNADRHDIAEATAMNRAMWPATLGYFAEQMLAARLSPPMRAELGDLFTGFVTGRGWLPAVRVGRQPYGILPTTAFSRWRAMPGEPAALVTIKTALDKMAETWRALSAGVARAGAGTDPEKELIDVLGLQASSVSFDQCRAVGPDYLWNAAAFTGADPGARREAHRVVSEQLVQAIGHDLRGTRTRVQVGRSWLRLLARRFGDDRYRALYTRAYAVDATGDLRVQQWHGAVAAHAVDGIRLIADARAGVAIEAATAGDLHVADGDKPAVREVLAELVAVYARAVSVPQPDEQTWVPEALEYRFGVTMRSQAGATTELASPQYYGGHLDWYDFDVHASAPGAGPAAPTTRTYLPTPVTFAGMPSARWWEIEDERLDLGAVDAHTTDLATLMLIEFGLTFGNDWSVVALPVAAGSLCRVTSVVVTDVFGQLTSVAPASADGSTWSMFELAAGERAPALFVPSVIAAPREGVPIERVDFMRDEMANFVWAVESTLPDGLAGGRDAFEDRIEPPVATPPSEVLRYQLMSTVPEPWIPFVPVHVPGSSREVQLQRGAMLRNDGTPVHPRGELLRPMADQPYFIHEEEIGRAGVQVTRRWRRIRTADGRVVMWLGRYRTTSAGEGSSGLGFDEAR